MKPEVERDVMSAASHRPTVTSQTAEPDIAERLIVHLREALQNPGLTYAEPPARIRGGYDTLIYGFRLNGAPGDFSRPLILRVFRRDNAWPKRSGEEFARLEAAAQSAVAGQGYPVPRVLLAETQPAALGAPFLIMERIAGRVMLDVFFRPSLLFLRLPRILAETQARLHALDPRPLLQAVEAEGLPPLTDRPQHWLEQLGSLIESPQLDGLRPGLTWLAEHWPPRSGESVICHGDFHPINILMAKGKVSGVLDWSWVCVADPAYDVGATIALFTQGPVSLPAFVRGLADVFRRRLAANYLRAYRRLRPLDPQAVVYYEATRCFGFLAEASQHRPADAGVIERPEKPTAFAAPGTVSGTTSRFEKITGVTVTIPGGAGRTADRR